MDARVRMDGSGRRIWPKDLKRQIVEETYQADCPVSEVARRHGLEPTQVYQWRKQLGARTPEPSMHLVRVEVTDAGAAADVIHDDEGSDARAEIVFPNGIQLFVPVGLNRRLMSRLISAVKAS